MKNKKIGILVYGLHRTGTMFLYQLWRELCKAKGIRYFSKNNVPPDDEELSSEVSENFCIGPIRDKDMIKIDFPKIDKIYCIIQLRDPRDILVSEYFSFGWSHPIENAEKRDGDFEHANPADMPFYRDSIKKMSIEEYALKRAGNLKERYNKLLSLAKRKDIECIFVRYEEMVTSFETWLVKILLPFDDTNTLLRKMHKKYEKEFSIEKEDIMNHKRKIIPQDYKEKLNTSTVYELNKIFQEILTELNYKM
jgi:hypothetical protein